MLLAASFLRDFVGTTGDDDDARTIPWAHLDIAGPAEQRRSGLGLHRQGADRRGGAAP